ncbi:ABC transporter permease [Candidatus Woesearchaeota archaeon]|nr:ABC transporter permease [Candidatus Woesearchaeota archaeon]
MLNKFIKLIQKNFKLLIRSKASALIVILGPLLVILLLGFAFDNTNTYALNIGIYSSNVNEIVNSFIDKLSEKQFNVVKTNTETDCVQRIKEGALHTCVIFPNDFSIVGENRNNEVTFYVDYSRINMVYLILETLTNKISLRSKEISMELTNTLLTSLEETRKEVFSKKPLLSKLISDNKQISSNIQSITTDLSSLDLNVNIEEFNMPELKAKILESDKEEALSSITSARSKVSAAMALATSLSGGDEVVSDLNSAYSSLTNAKSLLESGANNTGELMQMIELSYNKIIETSDKLQLASKTRTDANTLLLTIKTNIDESLSSLESIQEAFNKIDNSVGSVQISGADEVVSPIKTNIKAVTSETTHLNLLFPSLIVLVIMFVSILLATTLVMMEKHSPAYFRNFISPVSDFWFVISIYFTNMVLVLIQIIIIIGISIVFFSPNLITTILEASVSLVLITTIFTVIGMLIGYLFNSEETGTLGAISIGSLFLLLSNLIIPLESVPESFRVYLSYNPFVIAEDMLKKVLVYGQPLETLSKQVFYLIGISLAIFFLIILINVIRRRNLLKGWGSLTPGSTKFALIPSFLKFRKKSIIEKVEEKEDKEKNKYFSVEHIEKAKKNVKEASFFKYL